MIKWTKNGVSVLAILDTRHIHKDNTYTAKIQVCYKSRQVYYSTGKCLTISAWSELERTKKRELIAIRNDIESTFELIRNAVDSITTDTLCFSFDELAIRLRGASMVTVVGAIDNRITQLDNDGRIGTANVYRQLRRTIVAYRGCNTMFADVTPRWLANFDGYMTRHGIGRTSIAICMRSLRAVINDARRAGIISDASYPFGRGKYIIQETEGRKYILVPAQIELLRKYESPDNRLLNARDIWLFSYYCNGINVADILRLKYSNIHGDDIIFERKKTSNTLRTRKDIVVCLTPPLREIIERRGNIPRTPNTYIFGNMSDSMTPVEALRYTKNYTRHLNTALETIGKELGIEHFTTYTARHTFATVLSAANVNIKHISESLGHTSVATTERYIHSLDRQARRDIAEVLLESAGEKK